MVERSRRRQRTVEDWRRSNHVGRHESNNGEMPHGNQCRRRTEHAHAARVTTSGRGVRRVAVAAVGTRKGVRRRQEGEDCQQAGGKKAAHEMIMAHSEHLLHGCHLNVSLV